jgi:hypothetical protein
MRLIDEIEESDAHGGRLGRGEIGPVASIIGPAPLGGMATAPSSSTQSR